MVYTERDLDIYAKCPLLYARSKSESQVFIPSQFCINTSIRVLVNLSLKQAIKKLAERTIKLGTVPSDKEGHEIIDEILISNAGKYEVPIVDIIDHIEPSRNLISKAIKHFSTKRSPTIVDFKKKLFLKRKSNKNICINVLIDYIDIDDRSINLTFLGIEEEPLNKFFFTNTLTFAAYYLVAKSIEQYSTKNKIYVCYRHVENFSSFRSPVKKDDAEKYTTWLYSASLEISHKKYYPRPGSHCISCPFKSGCVI